MCWGREEVSQALIPPGSVKAVLSVGFFFSVQSQPICGTPRQKAGSREHPGAVSSDGLEELSSPEKWAGTFV